jgi:ribulose-5-phosphate 4-epimerase/fuculose-1-phosphate aldolase
MTSPDSALKRDLVTANHILYRQGVVDAFGHVSARLPSRPDRFLLSRNMAPGTVAERDILEFGLDGVPVAPDAPKVYLERFIHSEIYRLRPDVMAVVHSHSPSVVPFSVVPSVRLRPMCHMCGFLGAGAPIFEIRNTAGPATDLLITSHALGAALAHSLAGANVVLMRGHGSTVIAPDLHLAVYRAVYTETNAKLQAAAMQLGAVEYLTPQEAQTAQTNIEKTASRAWDLWAQLVENDLRPTSDR